MQPATHHTVRATRDAVADLLRPTQPSLDWPVRTALAAAFNYLDDALPVPAPPPRPADDRTKHTHHADNADVAARVEALRTDLLRLLEQPPDETCGDIDPYAIGHAAGELGAALREVTQGRPA